MSKTKEKHESDDEFQDALSDSTAATSTGSPKKASEDIVEEVVEKQEKLTLNDDDESDPIPKEALDGLAEGEEEPTVELDDEFDEEMKRETEMTMTDEQLLEYKEKANKMKLEGNELFKNDEADKAVAVYTEGLRICPTTYTKELAVLYGNRAAAKIKLEAKKSALHDCTKAIELWPEYVRVLIRRAKLYELEEKYEDALADYKSVYDLDPGHPDAREAMVRLPPMIEERNERMKEEMMSKLKDLGNMILKPFGLSTSNFQMQKDPNTGSYSINFNQK